MTTHHTGWKERRDGAKLTEEEGEERQKYVRKMAFRRRKRDRGRR